VGLYWVHVGVWGNEIVNELARDGSALTSVGPEVALGFCRQDIRKGTRCWLVNQHWVWWWVLGNTRRQAWELILGPCPGAKAGFLSFNRTQTGKIIQMSGINYERNNSIAEEIKGRISLGNKAFYANQDLFKSKLLTKNSKLRMYKTLVRPAVTCACETWLLKENIKTELRVWITNQLDVTFVLCFIFSFISCSTCFRQLCAHHQELTTG